MDAWMIAVVIVLLGLVGLYITQLVRDHRLRRAENDIFFEKANEDMGLKYNPEMVKQYEDRKKAVFDQYKTEKKWEDPERLINDSDSNKCPPEDSWLREIPTKELAALKATLVKRALNLIPTLGPFQQEMNSKFNLLQRGLISEKAWEATIDFRNVINHEVMQIRHEAECLQPAYGFSGQIFKEAQTYFDHDMKKRNADMMKMRLMQTALAQGLSQEDAIKFVNMQMSRMMSAQQAEASPKVDTSNPPSSNAPMTSPSTSNQALAEDRELLEEEEESEDRADPVDMPTADEAPAGVVAAANGPEKGNAYGSASRGSASGRRGKKGSAKKRRQHK